MSMLGYTLESTVSNFGIEPEETVSADLICEESVDIENGGIYDVMESCNDAILAITESMYEVDIEEIGHKHATRATLESEAVELLEAAFKETMSKKMSAVWAKCETAVNTIREAIQKLINGAMDFFRKFVPDCKSFAEKYKDAAGSAKIKGYEFPRLGKNVFKVENAYSAFRMGIKAGGPKDFTRTHGEAAMEKFKELKPAGMDAVRKELLNGKSPSNGKAEEYDKELKINSYGAAEAAEIEVSADAAKEALKQLDGIISELKKEKAGAAKAFAPIIKDIKEAAKAQEDEKTTQVSAAVAKQFISALNEIKSLYAKRLSYEIKASKTAAAQYKAVLKKCAKAAGKDEKKEEK